MKRTLKIERDDDCDCPRWLRWRVVAESRWPNRGDMLIHHEVLAHAITRRGARRKLRRMALRA